MAATITDATLRFNAAMELGLVKEGDGTLNNDWDLWLTDKSTEVREYLISRELCWWTADAIPRSVSLGLSYLVATAARKKWGKDYDQATAGIDLIREVAAKRPSNEHTKAKYF